MSDNFKPGFNLEEFSKEIMNKSPYRRQVSQSQSAEIAELKKEINELKSLLEKQLKQPATRNEQQPMESESKEKEPETITFRDIQQAKTIYSIPERTIQRKTQMQQHHPSNNSFDRGFQQRNMYRPPINIQHPQISRSIESETRGGTHHTTSQHADENNEESEPKHVIVTTHHDEEPVRTTPENPPTSSEQTKTVKKEPSHSSEPRQEKQEVKENNESTASSRIEQQLPEKQPNQPNQSSQIFDASKKTMLDFIFGKMKPSTLP